MGIKFVLYTTGLLTLGCIILLGFTLSNGFIQPNLACGYIEPENKAFCATFSFPVNYSSETVNLDIGKQLFRRNCKQCHNPSMIDDMTGPALGGLMERWNNDTTAVHAYIQNPLVYIAKSTDPRIKAIEHWSPSTMTAFPSLSYDEVRSIVEYIELKSLNSRFIAY